MALDAANFISELSIVDPPGTDPLSQGDDQIRTIKRATQQSFPLIAAAVNIDDVQMNNMAIQNENNVWTAADNQYRDVGFRMNALTDVAVQIKWEAAGLSHWQMRMHAAVDGTDYEFNRFDVLGAFLETVYRVSFATGVVDFTQVPTVLGAPLWIAGEIRMFAITAVPGTNWFLADGTNGTVNMTERIPMQVGALGVGTLLSANIIGTAAAGTTGGTAITEAQMPVHTHRIWSANAEGGLTDVTFNNAARTNTGANRSNNNEAYRLTTRFGDQVIENTGSGNAHTHSSPSQAVTEVGDGRDVCRPHSVIVEMFQYVP